MKIALSGLFVFALTTITAAQAEAPTMRISFKNIGWEPGAQRVINGVVQPIVTVVASDERGTVTPSAPWMREIAPDVATNTLVDPRLVVIVMDDALADTATPFELKQFRLIVRAIIDQLGPSDLATVVFTGDNRAPQDFTTDRQRLLAALDRFHPTGVGPLRTKYAWNTMQAAIELLRSVPERRSAIFFVGRTHFKADQFMLPRDAVVVAGADGSADATSPLPAGFPTVYTFSVAGFTGRGSSFNRNGDSVEAVTGGRAVFDTNTPADAVPAVFEELSIRYTIGYHATEAMADGRFRKIQVRVNRPDVIVEPRDQNYYAAKSADLDRVAGIERATSATTLAMSGIVPLADEPLRVAIAPFAPAADRRGEVAVAVTLGIEVPADFGQLGDLVELQTRVFDAEGRKEIQTLRQSEVLKPRSRGQTNLDVHQLMTLKPGRYNLRMSMHSGTRARAGSVYTDFVVPDFAREAFSASAALVSLVDGGRTSVRSEAVAGLLPVVPTARRVFTNTERPVVFLRIHTAGRAPASRVRIRSVVRNSDDAVVFEETKELDAQAVGTVRFADYSLALPLARLVQGEYLLSIEATPLVAGTKAAVQRYIRFGIR